MSGSVFVAGEHNVARALDEVLRQRMSIGRRPPVTTRAKAAERS